MKQTLVLTLSHDNKEAKLVVDNPNNEQVKETLLQTLAFFGIETSQSKIEKLYADFKEIHTIGEATEKNDMLSFQPINSQSPLINTNEIPLVTEVPPKEDKIEEPVLPKGIRIINGCNAYRTSYRCTKCNHTGTRYLLGLHQKAICHDCGYRMNVELTVGEDKFKKPIPNEHDVYYISK